MTRSRMCRNGRDTSQRGVGILMSKTVSRYIMGYWAILIRLRGRICNINIMQIYAPTNDSTKEIDRYCGELTEAEAVIFVMGDLNAKVDERSLKTMLNNMD